MVDPEKKMMLLDLGSDPMRQNNTLEYFGCVQKYWEATPTSSIDSVPKENDEGYPQVI